MNRTTMAIAFAVAITPLLLPAPESAGQTPGQPPNFAAGGASSPQAPDGTAARWEAGRADWRTTTAVGVAWNDLDAQKKAAAFLGSHQAHREAIVSLQQCHSCHGGGRAEWVLDNVVAAANQPTGPWIGVSVAPADAVLRSQLRLPDGTGVVVTQVVPGGPAQQAGVEVDDVLLSVDGKPVAGGEDLDKVLRSANPDGPPVTLKVLHAGEPVEKRVTPRKADTQTFLDAFVFDANPTYQIGVDVAMPDQTLRRHLKLGDAGLVVSEVNVGSPAEAAGVKPGDVLLSVGGKRLTKQEDLTDAVVRAAESPADLELMRGGVTLKISVTPAKEQPGPTSSPFILNFVVDRPGHMRELMLVRPGSAQVFDNTLAGSADPAAPGRPTTQPADDRLSSITEQLDGLRQAVEALRRDVARERGVKPEDEK